MHGGSRLFLHADIFDDFLLALVAKIFRLKIGDSVRRGDRHRRHHQ